MQKNYHQTFLQKIQNQVEPEAYSQINADPSADDFIYFRNQAYDQNDVKITERYKKYNNTEGNSSVISDNSEYSSQATNIAQLLIQVVNFLQISPFLIILQANTDI